MEKNVTKLRERQFATLAWIVQGTESNLEIHETNVVQYTFTNLGTTIVTVGGITLFPLWSGFSPTEFVTNHSFAENDVSVYKYRFDGLPKIVLARVPYITVGPPAYYNIPQPFPGVAKFPGFVEFNQLQIVAKIRANRRKS